jgi:hypothetical protein
MKITVESLTGHCQVNPRNGAAPLVLGKKGDKKVFEVEGDFFPYAEAVHSLALAGHLKVTNEDVKVAPVKEAKKEEKKEPKVEEKKAKDEKKESKAEEKK